MRKLIHAIGLGPGDPESINLKALATLKNSDVVVTPESDKNGRSLAKEIVSKHISSSKIFTYYFPMNNDKNLLDKRYKELAEIIDNFLSEGKKVSYVTIGDLSIYSTFNYLEKKLKLFDIDVIKIPGIPSFIAAANRINESLVVKDEPFCVVELSNNLDKLDDLLSNFPTVVIMKVYKRLNELVAFVRNSNLVKKGFLIERATLPEERVFDLLTDDIPEEAGYLSTAILFSRVKDE
ncbi:precorrin-2 C(20)-methyltransferase [Calditerrivibrio nitroreducens]|uniref:Precorrin-2 C20-methyltransferase n=1 Tax=Calditerrivibrio nitroreducens (strain DSM 19672 / NBRC 101217 / Yu37-1) TaxID=768670 RepID=E4TKD4_CALNY|nr:precorrin-2 C(20)-methyltransferase [Calditerrivibrio nitroreducens]ADR20006.1 precorrin-2 C20-methyltransferase [Calditerrivibrio nitroreducens DSM 19672]